ncbi:hypothetical protein HYPSUDRAFT_208450 [Hypholoma sublateritium FD-334 SS-4]|uniref:Uncharacterized protein n=1 Tax=Hypholoma sublateritium (strain FD-334 SS-4) TaxID=945553 RepID=A0A0D2NDQ3_HYPSF|nr:hypothetical protein HYPSUDRAFT_208450 [Hypholoma sublateritium FD-334 SS-4]
MNVDSGNASTTLLDVMMDPAPTSTPSTQHLPTGIDPHRAAPADPILPEHVTSTSTSLPFDNTPVSLPTSNKSSVPPLDTNSSSSLTSSTSVPTNPTSTSGPHQPLDETTSDLMDIDRIIPFKRTLTLTEAHPLLRRVSLITIELRDPNSHTTLAFHVGQVAMFIATDARLRRGYNGQEVMPVAYSTFAALFNSSSCEQCHEIRFSQHDPSIKFPIITGIPPRLSDFEIAQDLVYPPRGSPLLTNDTTSQEKDKDKTSPPLSSRITHPLPKHASRHPASGPSSNACHLKSSSHH